MDLTDRVAVVTGAASGIGLAITRHAVARGMRVVAADIEGEALESAVSSFADGRRIMAHTVDVRSWEQVDALRDHVESTFGVPDLVFSNAGVIRTGLTAWGADLADWSWLYDVNVWGAIHMMKAFVPAMVERDHGRVIFTASMAGLLSSPKQAIYSSTKHAVVAIAECLHHDLEASGSSVRCSVLCPGLVDTRIFDSERNWPDNLGRTPPSIDAIPSMPLGESIRPDAVAEIAFGAIADDGFWILTHEGRTERVAAHLASIQSGQSPPKTWLM